MAKAPTATINITVYRVARVCTGHRFEAAYANARTMNGVSTQMPIMSVRSGDALGPRAWSMKPTEIPALANTAIKAAPLSIRMSTRFYLTWSFDLKEAGPFGRRARKTLNERLKSRRVAGRHSENHRRGLSRICAQVSG